MVSKLIKAQRREWSKLGARKSGSTGVELEASHMGGDIWKHPEKKGKSWRGGRASCKRGWQAVLAGVRVSPWEAEGHPKEVAHTLEASGKCAQGPWKDGDVTSCAAGRKRTSGQDVFWVARIRCVCSKSWRGRERLEDNSAVEGWKMGTDREVERDIMGGWNFVLLENTFSLGRHWVPGNCGAS